MTNLIPVISYKIDRKYKAFPNEPKLLSSLFVTVWFSKMRKVHSLATLLDTFVQQVVDLNIESDNQWQQFNAFRHVDTVTTTCWSSN